MFRQVPPDEGGSVAPIQFSYTPTPRGCEWTAWLAGTPWWGVCHTHPDHTSKPCLKWITKGGLPCPRCNTTWFTEELGHVPLYRESDRGACLVMLRKTARDLCDGLGYGCYVTVSRDGGKKTQAVVTKHPKQKKFVTSLVARQRPAELDYSLLQMWKLNELTEWMRANGGTAVPEPKKVDFSTVDPDAPGKVEFPLGPLAAHFEAGADRSAQIADLNRRNAETVRRMEAERNGKHDKK